MGETGSVALLRPIFVVTHYRAGNLRTENLRNLYGVEGGTLTKVVASDKQSEPMLDRWISTHAAHEHWITTGRLPQEFEFLAGSIRYLVCQTGDVAAWSRQRRDHAGPDRVRHRREHDRDDRCRLLCRDGWRGCR